jgi:nucleoside-diphosphate-sugar epimerase
VYSTDKGAKKGNVGSAILAELLKNGLDVTVISRSSQEAPAGARAVQADYNSITSLSSALKGHDAVVSAVGAAGIVGQKVIIDAAILAGVKRFIPSDYGSVSADPEARDEPTFLPFITIQDYLKEKATAGEIEYTIVSTGPFLDLVFGTPLFVDFHNRLVELYGDGKLRLSSTSIAGVGKAVAGALVNADKTKNRVLHIQETVVSQVKVLDLAKAAASEGAEWKEMSVDPEETLAAARVNAAKDTGDILALYALIKAIMLSGKYETEYREVDNDLIGLVQLTDEDLKAQFVPLLARAP